MAIAKHHRIFGWLVFGLIAGLFCGQVLAYHFFIPPWSWWRSLEYGRLWVAILIGSGVIGALCGAIADSFLPRAPCWFDWLLLALVAAFWAMLFVQVNVAVE